MSQLRQRLVANTGSSEWGTRQVLDSCAPLTPEQIDLSLGASHSSILRTFRHIHDGERVWLRRLVEGGSGHLPSGPAPEHTFEFLVQSWPELWRGYRDWLESAADAQLTQELSSGFPRGSGHTP